MWWPRPRWKGDWLTNFIFPLLITISATTDTAMADEGQQHCGDNDMSAVVWTTALCTMLFVLVMIAIYFVYCKKRKHDWSSLWWKNNSDKNIMLQTSSPAKEKSQIHCGTDNPAFLADNNVVGRIVHVPLSTVDVGSIGIELSEIDGKQIYTCKQKDGSIDHLIAMRLVFDKKQQQQQQVKSSLDLNQTLVELSRNYGLRVELETEGKSAGDRCGGDVDHDDDTAKCAKSNNLLSTVCGKAQRLWNHQKQFVLKGGENHGGVHAAAGNDVEDGRSNESVHKTAATTVVAVIDETPRKGDGSLRRYNTLEYGASPADADDEDPVVELSLERHCTIDASEPVAATVVAAVGGSDVNTTKTTTCDDGPAAAKWDESTKHASVNPPPPPPRKYSAPVVPAAVAVIAPKVDDTRPASTPDKPSARDEIRMDDDYYWCTTTAMAPPPRSMSTFGKGPSSVTAADGRDGDGVSGGDNVSGGDDASGGDDVSGETFDGDETVVSLSSLALRRGDGDGTTVVQMTDDVDDCGGTTSIEDASLPSFPSDEDEDDECAPPPSQNGTAAVQHAPHAAAESKSPTKLPTLRLSLSTPPSGTSAVTSCDSSLSVTTSTSSSSSSSSTNSGHNNSGMPIVSKIPVRRQSAGSGFAVNFTTCTNSNAKKSIPFPLSKSTSRLAM